MNSVIFYKPSYILNYLRNKNNNRKKLTKSLNLSDSYTFGVLRRFKKMGLIIYPKTKSNGRTNFFDLTDKGKRLKENFDKIFYELKN